MRLTTPTPSWRPWPSACWASTWGRSLALQRLIMTTLKTSYPRRPSHLPHDTHTLLALAAGPPRRMSPVRSLMLAPRTARHPTRGLHRLL